MVKKEIQGQVKAPEKEEWHRRSYTGLEKLTLEVRHLTRQVLGKRGFTGADILESWSDILGSELSQGVRPVKLTFEKDSRINGTLYVKSAGGAFAMLFENQKERVIERINTFFGYRAVSQIKILQGRLTLKRKEVRIPKKTVSQAQKEKLRQQVAVIEDEELREKVYQLGISRLEKQ